MVAALQHTMDTVPPSQDKINECCHAIFTAAELASLDPNFRPDWVDIPSPDTTRAALEACQWGQRGMLMCIMHGAGEGWVLCQPVRSCALLI